MATLGKLLKDARTLNVFTLRQVEEATGISNAYLSQLENEKIKMPSVNALYKLATFYKIELDDLLEACGIIKKTEKTKEIKNRLGELSPTEEERLIEYLTFLRQSKKPKKPLT